MNKVNKFIGNAVKGAQVLGSIGAFQNNYLEFQGMLTDAPNPKDNQLIDFGEDFAIAIKVLKNGEIEIMAIIDSSIAPIVGNFGIRAEMERTSPRVTTSLFYEKQEGEKTGKVIHTTLSKLAFLCNNFKVPSTLDIHHENYFKDGRICSMAVLTKEEHGKTGGAKLKSDEEFGEYIRTELLGVDIDTFNRILEDLKALGRMYPRNYGIYLKGVNLKDTPLSEFIDSIEDYVVLSKR